jgi:hypothetical protein
MILKLCENITGGQDCLTVEGEGPMLIQKVGKDLQKLRSVTSHNT